MTTTNTPTDVAFTPAATNADITFTSDAEATQETTTLCRCPAIRISPHIFVNGLCEQDDEDPDA